MNIQLHIERLVLDGLEIPFAQQPRLQAALEGELARLLAEGGLGSHLANSGSLASVRAGPIQLPANGSPRQLGVQIARAVYQGIGAQPAPPATGGRGEEGTRGRGEEGTGKAGKG